MLAWLDQVSTQSAAQAVRTAASELHRKQPDLAVIAEQVQKARKLLPKAEDAEKKDLPPQLDAITAFLDKTLAAQTEKLLAEPAVSDPKASYGPWVPRFLLADHSFGDHPAWKKSMQKPKDLAKAHDKLVEKALKGLDKPTKDSRAAAAKTYAEAFLSTRAEELRQTLDRAFEAAGAAEAENRKSVATLKQERDKAAAEAAKAAAELLAPLLEELKAAAPALFAATEEGGTQGDK